MTDRTTPPDESDYTLRAALEALVARGDVRTLDDIDEPAVLLADLRELLDQPDWDFGSDETFRCAGTPGCDDECTGLCGEHYPTKAEKAQVSHCPGCGRGHVVVGLDSVLLETRPTLRRHACGVGGPGSGCSHEWLDRPESDTRECLICGTEVAG